MTPASPDAAPPRAGGPERIAVLGGGAAALAAVFEITDDPTWRDRYSITVYQVGWRLGGKGASGRNLAHSAQIEEHGLHIWPGFYDNAFDLMQRCYAALGRDAAAPLATWRQAFSPLSNIFILEEVDGRAIPWRIDFGRNSRTPGKGDPFSLSPASLVRQLLDLVGDAFFRSPLAAMLVAAAGDGADDAPDRPQSPGLDPPNPLVRAQQGLERLLSNITGAVAEVAGGGPSLRDLVVGNLDAVRRGIERIRLGLARDNHALRRLATILELGVSLVRGMVVDDIAGRGFDHLDEQEWSDWMRGHGASEELLNSALVRCCYDFAFAYEDGVAERRAMAAGSGSRLLMRLVLTYKDAFFFKMTAGMGDAIFAPLHEVLSARGVQFRFFHRVRSVVADREGHAVEEIVVGRQVDLAGGASEYRPLVDVKGLPSWPAAPDYRQIVQGPELLRRGIDLESHWTDWTDVARVTLRRGVDFDSVILGISIAALPEICADLVARDPRWRDMTTRVKTIQTQALQIWMRSDHAQLGWPDADAVVTAFAKPFDTWADLTHLQPREGWTPPDLPRMIGYFCGVMDDPPSIPPTGDSAFPGRELVRVRANADAWEREHLKALWPNFDERNVIGRYWRANVNPSDRYVLTVPGSTKYRMRAGESGFANLFLAGDWVRNDVNGGCVEGAVTGGLAAAHALTERSLAGRGPKATRLSPNAAELGQSPWRLVHGVGRINAASFTLPMPTASLERLLPRGLRLGSQGITGQGLHPVGIMFTVHSEVRPNIIPFGGISYREFVVVIPHVEHVDRARSLGPMTFVARMHVSDLLPLILGLPYGYGKRLGVFDYDAGRYRISGIGGELIAEARLREVGRRGSIGAFPHFAIARTMLEQPLVAVDPFGGFHYSYSEMHLETATFTPLAGSVVLGSGALDEGAPRGLEVGSIVDSPLGAFFIDTHWTLTNAFASGSLAASIRSRLPT